uniref:NADH-ubiquinone oxidoreductase chain 2 n=1 Tax=Pagellus acarne TaxID=98817 RepID=A0A343W4N7_PAGAC|nr:NADH dehydrogenase subunit 2 [Pagellus acarne]AVV92440.1 NADH dehydrogenase subunit 2 [Pagellus acarne]
MSPFILATLLFALGLGTTITFASSHWLLAWMGLEINTLAILPLMAQLHHPRAVEATTKYFVAQATAAAMLMFASGTNAWLTGQWNIQLLTHPLPVTLITLAIGLKIGLAPMHSWLPEVIQGVDFITGLILSTWQKLAPFVLLLQLQPTNSALLLALGIASTLVGGWGGLNQTQIRKILAYSSIAHLGWMTLVLQYSTALAVLTLILYFTMTFSAFLLFKLNNSTTINLLAMAWAKVPAAPILAPLILLSLAGLPPLTGFLSKWLILQELTKQGLAPLATLAALSALLSLYFYLRLAYALSLTISPNTHIGTTPWRHPTSTSSLPFSASTIAAIFLLPMAPAIAMLCSI